MNIGKSELARKIAEERGVEIHDISYPLPQGWHKIAAMNLSSDPECTHCSDDTYLCCICGEPKE